MRPYIEKDGGCRGYDYDIVVISELGVWGLRAYGLDTGGRTGLLQCIMDRGGLDHSTKMSK